MRTTIDIPDDLYRTLKTRAAIGGSSLRELIQQLIESGLRQADTTQPRRTRHRPPPPVIIPPTAAPIPALSPKDYRQLEDDEDRDRDHGA